ncbi:hypothetical protein [Dickeya lacustris]|uniref:Uncharacterized protein n=1 Tax=Dickeya lacustris TaxID=2259638 RepID=A0ABY8G6N3_9GAMM|nr:hypothetical protein [Dickeya lacustris]WFN55607.1 hypothetical protein O1Q98_18850 [Dickeya lacustris]
MLYTIRENKGQTENIIIFEQPFFRLIQDEDAWVIRVYLYVIKENVEKIKSNVVFDLDSYKRINEIIVKNGEHKFDAPILNYINDVFIHGITQSAIKDPEVLFLMIKVFFERIKCV